MKKIHLKSLVEFIVRRTFAEMSAPAKPSYEFLDSDSLMITGVDSDDGRIVGGEFSLQMDAQSSGIGSHEYWGSRENDRGTTSILIQDWTLVRAWDEATNQEMNIHDAANAPVVEALNSAIMSLQKTIERDLNSP